MHSRPIHLLILLAVLTGSVCALAAANEERDRIFPAQELGFPEIDTAIIFAPESERTYRVHYSKLPAGESNLAMLYTSLLFCAARKLAIERGFDRFGLALVDPPGPSQSGIVFFLRPGESAGQVLEPRLAAVSPLPVNYPTIASGCDTRANGLK
jgi:hypothetical protein